MKIHSLKTWPFFFQAILDGEKTFEVRLNDRDFAVDDILELNEWDPADLGSYTGRKIRRVVTYVMHGGKFGLDPQWVILAIAIDAVSP